MAEAGLSRRHDHVHGRNRREAPVEVASGLGHPHHRHARGKSERRAGLRGDEPSVRGNRGGAASGIVGLAIPATVRQALGLDDEPSWIVVSEHNVDEWPNAGLAPLPGRPGVFSYGLIPPSLFARVKA
jgi:hypothetical protein